MGFFSWLTLLFILLKACGIISLSWWWVLTPVAVYMILYTTLYVLVMKYPLYFLKNHGKNWR